MVAFDAMTKRKAISIAESYLKANPLNQKDYVWRLSEPEQVSVGWYFDYEIECAGAIPPDEWIEIGGAPGYLVPSDGTAPRDVSWEERR